MTTSLDQVLAMLQHLQEENQCLWEAVAQIHQAPLTPAQHQEYKISLPDEFDGTRSKFRGSINQVRLVNIKVIPRAQPKSDYPH
ncbi:hypothetical protein BJ085DRAFT_35839 [Dimargaris cristalligena]|uniref:Uncharacterized protein n=1 Tax=Dimargaris cristalligena TaxID=215637 RepID=A0A4P9ZK51_9FUNG|nr:hypothetical protein BJ085DRAFT_35839 [Dimargaris cristalligena]|eukprot:RKP33408.1 hypothetical protein BJ085DRAFT_35839 [Dimargaris cristalligena]